jgi:alanyl-tRNA synthetase
MSRLYYQNSYLREFDANIIATEGPSVYLDASAFYPTSGGQPHDHGSLSGVAVTSVEEQPDGRIAHTLASPVNPGPVHGAIDWTRRFDHMQQHTGQHLLSAVFMDLFGFQTLSFHMGAEVSTIDLATPALTQAQIEAAEQRANAIVFENRPVLVTFEDPSAVEGLRKASERAGELRIVTITDLDRSACGGTHVRATGEIGPIQIRKLDKIRGSVRLEFTCGLRTVSRTRRDFNALSTIARSFSAPLYDTPALVASQIEKLQEAEKTRRKLALELAGLQGKALYAETQSGRYVLNGSITDDVRALAQSFTSCPDAVFLALSSDPAAFLLAASKDSGVNAGALVKPLVAELGGRGGGSPQMAQGSLPSIGALHVFKQRITADWPSESI